VRYNERSAAERVNGSLKDDFGGRYVRVRGHAKLARPDSIPVEVIAVDSRPSRMASTFRQNHAHLPALARRSTQSRKKLIAQPERTTEMRDWAHGVTPTDSWYRCPKPARIGYFLY
jgi:hypothetical protein